MKRTCVGKVKAEESSDEIKPILKTKSLPSKFTLNPPLSTSFQTTFTVPQPRHCQSRVPNKPKHLGIEASVSTDEEAEEAIKESPLGQLRGQLEKIKQENVNFEQEAISLRHDLIKREGEICRMKSEQTDLKLRSKNETEKVINELNLLRQKHNVLILEKERSQDDYNRVTYELKIIKAELIITNQNTNLSKLQTEVEKMKRIEEEKMKFQNHLHSTQALKSYLLKSIQKCFEDWGARSDEETLERKNLVKGILREFKKLNS